MKSKVPFISPEFPTSKELIADYEKIIQNNWYTNFGPYEKRLREKIESFISQNIYVVTTVNATIGLQLAIKSFLPLPKIKARRVIMPAFTFIAGAEMLIILGYVPVLIDIDQKSLQPDLNEARSYIAKNKDSVVGILFCNTFGVGSLKIGEWEKLAKDFHLPLIIDTAAGFGSQYGLGEYTGARGACEVFSFHATKPFALGEGGAIVTRNKIKANELRRCSNFGFEGRESMEIGTNAKLQEINSAIGLRQLQKLKSRLKNRQKILAEYKNLLIPLGYMFQENDENSSVAFASVIAPSEKIANEYMLRLQENKIEARNYYNPSLDKHNSVKKNVLLASRLLTTKDICSRIVSLPVHKDLNIRKIRFICSLAIK